MRGACELNVLNPGQGLQQSRGYVAMDTLHVIQIEQQANIDSINCRQNLERLIQ